MKSGFLLLVKHRILLYFQALVKVRVGAWQKVQTVFHERQEHRICLYQLAVRFYNPNHLPSQKEVQGACYPTDESFLAGLDEVIHSIHAKDLSLWGFLKKPHLLGLGPSQNHTVEERIFYGS